MQHPAAHAPADRPPARARAPAGGMVITTVSGSDLMELWPRGLGRDRWWRSRWLQNTSPARCSRVRCLIGARNGGVGVGVHLPERDACWWPLLLGGGPGGGPALPRASGFDRLRAAPWRRFKRLRPARLRLKDMASRERPGAQLAEGAARSCGWSARLEASNTDRLKAAAGPEPLADACAFRHRNRCCGCIARPKQERCRGAAWGAKQFAEAVGAVVVAIELNGSNHAMPLVIASGNPPASCGEFRPCWARRLGPETSTCAPKARAWRWKETRRRQLRRTPASSAEKRLAGFTGSGPSPIDSGGASDCPRGAPWPPLRPLRQPPTPSGSPAACGSWPAASDQAVARFTAVLAVADPSGRRCWRWKGKSVRD